MSVENMSERREAALITGFAPIKRALGNEGFQKFVDAFLLKHKDSILKTAKPDNPGLIRLKALLAEREMGIGE